MGRRLNFDIEGDGLLDTITTIHSLCLKDVDTGERWSCHDHGAEHDIDFGLDLMAQADTLIGLNIQEFDLPAIELVKGWKPRKGTTVRDLLIMSRLIWPDMKDADFRRADDLRKKGKKWIPGHLFGRHSLESWGYRLGLHKGDYKVTMEARAKAEGLKDKADIDRYVWGSWNQEMQDYCDGDIDVADALWRRCQSKGFSEDSIQLEHCVRRIVSRQEAFGFAFDEDKANALKGTLAQAKHDLETELKKVFHPWFRNLGRVVPAKGRRVKMTEKDSKHFKPLGFKTKRDGTKEPIWPVCEYSPEAPYTSVKLKPFNPGSRDEIADRLTKLYGWRPKEFGKDGKPKVDEETLKGMNYAPVVLLRTYLMVQKRIGQVSGGNEAWLIHVKNGRIHGRINTMGAATSRMTHSKPNVAQVPGLTDKKTGEPMPYGYECRELFTVTPGLSQRGFKRVLVGCDADALELRDLAGYMAAFDGGAYIETVLRGNKTNGTDMHTLNAKALGCSRDAAKIWFYAFIYGSGDENLGNILGIFEKSKATGAGKKSRAAFLKSLPALNTLIDKVKAKAKKQGYIKGLDGRLIPVRKQHAALNTLLQSAGAIQMKRALVILDDMLQAQGLVPGVHYEFVANVHDEWQIEADEDVAELVGKTAEDAIRLAGEYYKFRCPLAGNAAMGTNWATTH